MQLKALFKFAADRAAIIFNESPNHEVLPMWHAIQADGQHALIATPWSNDEEKEETVTALRVMFQAKQVKRFAFVCEAWTVQAPKDESLENASRIKASKHPDRREVLMITAEDRDGTSMMGWYYILRPEHGPPKLSPLHMSDYDMSTGRMMGLLH